MVIVTYRGVIYAQRKQKCINKTIGDIKKYVMESNGKVNIQSVTGRLARSFVDLCVNNLNTY